MDEQRRDPNTFKVLYLKELLKKKGLNSVGNKAELIARLDEVDPSREWTILEDGGETDEIEEAAGGADGISESAFLLREIGLYKREKELAERELEVTRRELQFLRETGVSYGSNTGTAVEQNSRDKVNLSEIKELINTFDGSADEYANWEKQIKIVKGAYALTDEKTKVLISARMKGKALEWFHSKPENLELSLDDLFRSMKGMFDHKPRKLTLRRQFEERAWKYSESFNEYVHEKVIMGNRVPVDNDEVVDYFIEGIPDQFLKTQAKMQNFTEVEELMKAFEKVSLRARGTSSNSFVKNELKSPKTSRNETKGAKFSSGNEQGASD